VNGNKVSFDVAPYIDENSRTMVPLRFIAESLGCYVHWDPGEKRVTITRGGLVASLVLGQKSVTVNGKAVPMDTRAVEVGGRTMVPVRSIAEIFGARVSWDPGTWTVHIITSPEPAGAWVEVTGRVVNIRSGPGLDENPIGQVEFGTRLRVLEYGTGWVKVVTPWGEEGWISSQYVKRVDGAPEPPSDIPPGDIKGVIVTANGVRIRSGPGTDYQIIGQVNAG
ncbi:MAG: SH3 domain-containing protein, partial [Clostridia bacterium]|nr:SH3 domain-containing protein [Clostridia bacterium]